MESHPADLLRDALALPPDERSALIDSLIESLDATVDEGATERWKREIELRLKQIDDGIRGADLLERPARAASRPAGAVKVESLRIHPAAPEQAEAAVD